MDQKKPLTKRKKWTFRLLTLILIPACIIGMIEGILTLSGYGYSTDYFIKKNIAGKEFLIPNYKFSYLFFPRALARKPNLIRVPAEKKPGVFRIFVFGESAALGDPEPPYGFSRYLKVMLNERYPDTKFEVVNVAMTAINSHVILPIAQECALLDGDLWIIYMGNNEMVGPFGAGTVFGARAPDLDVVRSSLALKETSTGQLITDLVYRLGSGSDAPDSWEGINMFKKNLLRTDDPMRLKAYRNFEGNLMDILTTGLAVDVPIILSTVASNLGDCSPFSSLHRTNLSTSERAEWDQFFNEARTLEQTGQYESALKLYQQAAEIDETFAELQFRIGICQRAVKMNDEALRSFTLARDYDALAVRADSRINEIIIKAGAQSDQIHTVDSASVLAAQSLMGIPGRALFNEHVHFTVEGNYALARVIADQVSPLLPATLTSPEISEWPENKTCNDLLALTVWDQVRLADAEAKRVITMPFKLQTGNRANKEQITVKKRAILGRVTKQTAEQDLGLYEAALERDPEDTILIANYAQFLDGMGMTDAAIEQAEKFRTLLPDAWSEYYKAALLAKAGRLDEAEQCLKRALKMNRDIPQIEPLMRQIKLAR